MTRRLPLTIAGFRRGYAEGLDPVAIVDAVFDAIVAADDPGIFISLVDRDAVRAAAKALGPFNPDRPALWGVPFAVKDNIDVTGLVTTAACPAFAYRSQHTAPAVQRLLDAGAILIGKTNLDQFATGLVGVRTPYPVPRNAIDPQLVPGGSSSGSAVAVSRGLVAFALGTDTAGSGRVPAALNNIVGLKPSLGAVSTRGVVPACRTLDCVSIFALTVDDAWAVTETMANYDAEDAFSRPTVLARPSVPPVVRLGVPSQATLTFLGDHVAEAAFVESLAKARTTGATLIEVDLAPFLEVASLLYAGPWVAERYQAIRNFIATNADALHPVTRQIILSAEGVTAADAFAGLYRLAELRRRCDGIWPHIDALLVPTFPRPVTLADVAADPIGANSGLGTYTNFVNLLDLAALAVPGAQRSDGWPSGITLIAPRGRDGLLAGIGGSLHAATGGRLGATGIAVDQGDRRPPAPLQAEPGWHEIAVVGAHLSGLPLNHELTGAGGQFLRVARTEPCYRLHALAGGPPHRPGLLRVDAGAGVAIETEVWALPADGFGRFVAAIPSPLGVGTLRLADGTTPKGFLVEPEGLAGAADISAHGGWRAYLAAGKG